MLLIAARRAARRRRQPALPDAARHPEREHAAGRTRARWHVRPAAEASAGQVVRGRRHRVRRPQRPDRGTTGSIGTTRRRAYLPAHPDTFAELSVLDSNPANGGTFTFADANALNNLPYLTGLDRRQQRHQEGALQARHRLRPGPRPVHRQRTALPPRRVVAIRRRRSASQRTPSRSRSRRRSGPAACSARRPSPPDDRRRARTRSATSSPRPGRCS